MKSRRFRFAEMFTKCREIYLFEGCFRTSQRPGECTYMYVWSMCVEEELSCSEISPLPHPALMIISGKNSYNYIQFSLRCPKTTHLDANEQGRLVLRLRFFFCEIYIHIPTY